MYKTPQQRKFLFAKDQDQQKNAANPVSQSPMVSQPHTHNTLKMNALNNLKPAKVTPPTPPPVSPTAVPSLPQLDRLPKFGKIRNSLKNQMNKFIK